MILTKIHNNLIQINEKSDKLIIRFPISFLMISIFTGFYHIIQINTLMPLRILFIFSAIYIGVFTLKILKNKYIK